MVLDMEKKIKQVKKAGKPKEKKIEIKKEEKPKRSLLGRAKKEPAKEETKPLAQGDIDAFSTVRFVVMTEKAIQMIENQNKLVFVVDRNATKGDIKKAVEDAFSTNVSNVQTLIDQLGRKKAFVRFTKEGEAGEIAIKLGII